MTTRQAIFLVDNQPEVIYRALYVLQSAQEPIRMFLKFGLQDIKCIDALS